MRFFLDKSLYKTYNSTNELKYYPEMAPYYPLTGGYHIGTDYRIPSHTPIYAPADGEMIVSTVSVPKGNVGVFSFDYQGINYGIELCHLASLPKTGKYKEGDKIAESDNTGTATTAPHLHCVMYLNTKVTATINEISNANKNCTGSLKEKQKKARNKVDELIAKGQLIDTHKFFSKFI